MPSNQTKKQQNQTSMQMKIIRLLTASGAAAVLCLAASSVYVDRVYGGVVVVVPGPVVVPLPAVVVPLPNVYFWGGPYDRGRDVRDYSRRGFESRGAAHPVRGGARGGRR